MSIAPLKQFNEEENFSTTGDEKRIKLSGIEKLAEEFVAELHEEMRATKGISDWKMKEIFTQKLTAHKELILKMVREKVPNQFLCLDTDREIGWNDCRQEFLNNLDTI